jgi:RNA polymerase sigma-70 factor (ECF subfamily)
MERDSETFVQLLTGAQQNVHAFIFSLCHDSASAKDILQETNLTLWRKAEDFTEGTNFVAWACRVAYFHVLNHRRRQSREQLVFDEEVLDYLAERQEMRLESGDHRLEALQRCLTKLPEAQRELLERRYAAGASVQTMAVAAGKSEGALSQALFRIRTTLQQCIEKQMGTEAAR